MHYIGPPPPLEIHFQNFRYKEGCTVSKLTFPTVEGCTVLKSAFPTLGGCAVYIHQFYFMHATMWLSPKAHLPSLANQHRSGKSDQIA